MMPSAMDDLAARSDPNLLHRKLPKEALSEPSNEMFDDFK